tara:strand:- start:322 stop:651 length:330 start_codon:yes stop_codon:yes gene_type:complete
MELVTRCARIKLRKGTITEVKAWAKELNDRVEEVKESMIQEGVHIESVFLDKIEEDYYLIYYMQVEDEQKSQAAFEKSILDIDKYHAGFKKACWESIQSLQVLVDVSRL